MKNSIKNLLLIILCIVLCFMLGRSLYQVASSNKRMAMLKSQISSNKLDAVLNLVAT